MPQRSRTPPPENGSHWPLQDAKARLSELLRRAETDGPQHVTVHGRETAVVLSAEAYHRMAGQRTGQALVDALQASPDRDVELAPARAPMPVRDVDL